MLTTKAGNNCAEGEGRGSGCLVWTNGRRSLYSTMSFILHGYWVTQLTLNQLSLGAIVRVIINSMNQQQSRISFQELASSSLSPSYNAAAGFTISSMHRLEEKALSL